jgi:hypothetical protein
MRLFISLILLFLRLNAFGQLLETGSIVPLHPAVGNTISKEENSRFSLFCFVTDSLYESANLVQYNDSTYTILFHLKNQPESERKLSIDSLICLKNKIEKITPANSIPPPKHPVETNQLPEFSDSGHMEWLEESVPNPLYTNTNSHYRTTWLDLAFALIEAFVK